MSWTRLTPISTWAKSWLIRPASTSAATSAEAVFRAPSIALLSRSRSRRSSAAWPGPAATGKRSALRAAQPRRRARLDPVEQLARAEPRPEDHREQRRREQGEEEGGERDDEPVVHRVRKR